MKNGTPHAYNPITQNPSIQVHSDDRSSIPSSPRKVKMTAGVAVLSLLCVFFGPRLLKTTTPAVETSSPLNKPVLGFTAVSFYILKMGPIGEAYPWTNASSVAVDTIRPFSLKVTGGRDGDNCNFVWIIEGISGEFTGRETQPIVLSHPRSHDIILREECHGESGSGVDSTDRAMTHTVRQTTGRVVAVNVRREIRELTSSDRSRWLDALAELWHCDLDCGKHRYGDDYLSMREAMRWHHMNSAQRDADHFHQGIGFLAQHSKITLLVEKSMRLVDATVTTMPYWDASIETTQIVTGKIESVWQSGLWGPDVFGSIGGYIEKGLAPDEHMDKRFAIQDGRWAWIKAQHHRDGFHHYASTPLNAHGYLRAPWNINGNPYVTRFPLERPALVSCDKHYVYAAWKDLSLTRNHWMYDVSNLPHGPYHGSLGGMYPLRSSPKLEALLGASLVNTFRSHTLWRFHVIDYPASCNGTVECVATCNFVDYTPVQLGREVLKSSTWLPKLSTIDSKRDEELAEIARLYCEEMPMTLSGDAKDSAGCMEPSFWPIHPAIERLYQFRYLRLGWPDEEVGTAADDGAWPDEGACFGGRSFDRDPDRLAFTVNSTRGNLVPCTETECCKGHLADSRIFVNYANERTAVGLTNRDTIAIMDPTREPLDGYVAYHHFRWDHCKDVGFDFDVPDMQLDSSESVFKDVYAKSLSKEFGPNV